MADEHLEDPLPLMRAQLDQAIEMVPEIARATKGYYDAFVAEGFEPNQALYLTMCQLLNSPGEAP